MTESKLYNRLKFLLKDKNIILQRIEYATVPDLFFRHKNGEGWIEFKIVNTDGFKVRIPWRPGQFAWISKYVRMRGTAFLFSIDQNSVLWIIKDKDIKREYTIESFYDLGMPIDWNYVTGNSIFKILGE